MRGFSLLLSIFLFGCDGSVSTDKIVCPQCKMPLDKSRENSSFLAPKTYFDDIGCLILWTKEHKKEPKEAMVFTKDSKEYIPTTDAFYTINERTPMRYGFTAYSKKQPKSIKFDEVRLRMLRGEHMANPKIRKQILGE